MKIYVLYILSDYASAIYMSVDKRMCKKEMEDYRKRGGRCSAWIEEYDFAKAKGYELDCD